MSNPLDNINEMVRLMEISETRKVSYIKAWSIMLVEIKENMRQGKPIEQILADKEAQINRYADLKADPEQTQQMLDLMNNFTIPPLEDLLAILEPKEEKAE